MICEYQTELVPMHSLPFDIILFCLIFPYIFYKCTHYREVLVLLFIIHVYIAYCRYIYSLIVVWNIILESVPPIIELVLIYNECYILGGIMFIVHIL